ncbi:SDR family oxidoreductase [Mycolicibacterium sp. P1-5]|uniref:SDR family NAD(P)-dependent oxidoreductase n=1 Tax=Mycolicibacterium sp. P1-5 TaxID=2024617 RepID=UPI0011F0064A|nr:SDR family NAD(P)-dependent oxidoreductase [Mycolicibacterium sp. P1-5]KAA0110347.1 SDR family NAD(P)-dependent oxidoreductase [Mycolicibacterium sp. P1-5]
MPTPGPNRAALITGASSGIGAEIARVLSARGHHVVLVARRTEQLTELAESLPGPSSVVGIDLSQQDERAALPGRVAALGLDVDILVNNAGLSTMGPVADADPDAELNVVEVDVAAVVDLCTRFVAGMVSRRRGAVLNVASVAGFGPLPGQAVYGAAKAFVLSYSRALGQELKASGIAVTALCPGPVHTGFGEAAGISNEDAEAALPKPLWVSPEEVAAAAVDGLAAGKPVVVPGRLNRAATAVYHLTPRRLLLPLLASQHPAFKKK